MFRAGGAQLGRGHDKQHAKSVTPLSLRLFSPGPAGGANMYPVKKRRSRQRLLLLRLAAEARNYLGLESTSHDGRDGHDGPAISLVDASASTRLENPAAALAAARLARRDSFEESMQLALRAARLFGVLPVRARRRGRVLLTALLFTAVFVVACLAAARMLRRGVGLSTSSLLVFYGHGSLAVLLFSRMAVAWGALAVQWKKSGPSEHPLLDVPNSHVARARRLTAAMLAGALVEHVLSVGESMVLHWAACNDVGGFGSVMRSFFVHKFPMVFDLTDFAVWKALLLLFTNMAATFLWNFVDIVVVLMSFLLARRFETLNAALSNALEKPKGTPWWREARETYVDLASLTKFVDANLSPLVLLSFASNLYFICLQLLHNMKSAYGVMSYIYFFYSFGWLLTRAVMVSMTAASVFDQSVRPVETLYSVPSDSFCVEVQRFLVQTTTDIVALSGCKFFWVKRSLVLTLAGTVATYEIVLVQFHAEKDAQQAHNATSCV